MKYKTMDEHLGKRIIGILALDPTIGNETLNMIAPAFFVNQNQQKAFICVLELYYDNIQIDAVKIAERMTINGFYVEGETVDFLIDCIESVRTGEKINALIAALAFSLSKRINAGLSENNQRIN